MSGASSEVDGRASSLISSLGSSAVAVLKKARASGAVEGAAETVEALTLLIGTLAG